MSAGLLLGLGAAVCWGLTDIAGALAGRRVGSLLALAFAQVLSVVVLVVVILAAPGAVRWDTAALPTAVAVGVGSAVAYLAFFTALRIGPITVVSPVVAAYGGLVVVLAVVLRGESLTLIQAVGAAVATLGVVLTGLSFDGGVRRTRLVGPGVPFAIVALVFFAFVTVGLAGPIEQTGWLAAITWSRLGNIGAIGLVLAVVIAVRPRIAAPLLATSEPIDRGTARATDRTAREDAGADEGRDRPDRDGRRARRGRVHLVRDRSRSGRHVDRRPRELVRAGDRGPGRLRLPGRAAAPEPVGGLRGDRRRSRGGCAALGAMGPGRRPAG